MPLAGLRAARAILSESMTSSWRMCAAMPQPTIRRLNRSCTAARYSHPSPVRICLMSVAHTRSSGAVDPERRRAARAHAGTPPDTAASISAFQSILSATLASQVLRTPQNRGNSKKAGSLEGLVIASRFPVVFQPPAFAFRSSDSRQGIGLSLKEPCGGADCQLEEGRHRTRSVTEPALMRRPRHRSGCPWGP